MSAAPPKSAAAHQIALGMGTMGLTNGKPIMLDLADLKRHVLLCGGSGSGKTWSMKVIMEALLVRGVGGLAIDSMGDLLGLGLPVSQPGDYDTLGLRAPYPMPTDAEWALGAQIAEMLRKKLFVRILTPCSAAGEQLSILPLTGRPLGYAEIPQDELVLQADAQAANFLARVGLSQRRNAGAANQLDQGAATEILLRCWKQDLDLTGSKGLQRFGFELLSSPNPKLTTQAQATLRSGLASMELGKQRLWYDGIPLDFTSLMKAPEGKVPLLIVSIAHLDPADRVFAVGQILHSAFNWALSQGSSPDRPRLAVALDELAGDGGTNPLLPPGSVRGHASGDAIRRVLRQGRHYGLTMICGSQSPGDIDYKSFSNFGTALVGKLKTAHDIDRSIYGVQLEEGSRKRLCQFIASATPGRMFVVPPNGSWDCVKMRMLGCAHGMVQRTDIERYFRTGIWVRHAPQPPPREEVDDDVPNGVGRALQMLHGVLNEFGPALSEESRDELVALINGLH